MLVFAMTHNLATLLINKNTHLKENRNLFSLNYKKNGTCTYNYRLNQSGQYKL